MTLWNAKEVITWSVFNKCVIHYNSVHCDNVNYIFTAMTASNLKSVCRNTVSRSPIKLLYGTSSVRVSILKFQ
jgi:hypothetical protein